MLFDARYLRLALLVQLVLSHGLNVLHLDADVAVLAKRGVVRNTALGLKVLGEGDLSKKLDVKAAKFSASAKQKIEAAGGTAVEC